METLLGEMGDYLSFRLQPKYSNEVSQDTFTIASRIFSISEPKELILSFAETPKS